MTSQSAERLTTINRQEKAALIWAIADKLVGVYKPHEYGNVILPMCVIKRFEDTLAPTREAVWKKNEELGSMDDVLKGRFLRKEAGQQFFNTSKFTFQNLLADPDNIADNFDDYLQHFSDNVIDIIRRFEFDKEISKLEDNGLLYLIIQEFNSDKAYLGADRISSVDMGYIFEELVRKFSESYDEQRAAGMKVPDIALLKEVASACTDCNEPMNDYEFFSHLKKEKVKIAQGKVAMIRNFYGKRNPSMPEAYVKPTDKSSGFAPNPELKDSEIIPWKTNPDDFLEANVRPYAPDFWYDESETKIGYEIPFTREFYRYTAPRPATEIFEHFRALGEREQELMTKILGK